MATEAKCGRDWPHGAHSDGRWWCAGNRDIVAHATKAEPIQRKVLNILNRETGEEVRVTIEQMKSPTVDWPSPVDLYDIYVEEMEAEPDGNGNLDLLEVM